MGSDGRTDRTVSNICLIFSVYISMNLRDWGRSTSDQISPFFLTSDPQSSIGYTRHPGVGWLPMGFDVLLVTPFFVVLTGYPGRETLLRVTFLWADKAKRGGKLYGAIFRGHVEMPLRGI